MKKKIEKIVKKLKTNPKKEEFLLFLQSMEGLFASGDESFEYIKSCGMPIDERDGVVFLKTMNTPYEKELFCIVDIETNGSKPINSQIIELGAVKMRGTEVIDRFESFCFSDFVPEYVTKVTNITKKDLVGAPTMKDVLKEFKLFLGDALFVAHNVEFDYSFISAMLSKNSLGVLTNRKLCTIELAKKTIESEKYGLEFLNAYLEINTEVSHRAYADALTAAKLLEICLKNVPEDVKTTEELIDFSKHNIKKRKK
ncbi:MAG: 3'-5' exonuclease [Campylobacterales bacterium]